MGSFALLSAMLEVYTDSIRLAAGPSLSILTGLFLHVIAARAYVDTAAAAMVMDEPVDIKRELAYAGRRLPALTGVIVATLVAIGGAFTIVALAVGTLVWGFGLLPPTLLAGWHPTVLFGTVIAFMLYKFWVAPEACVAGEEGPLQSLRTSWRLTSVHRVRAVVIFMSFAVSASAPQLSAYVTAGWELPALPIVGVFATVLRWLTTALWYCVGVQLYARYVLGSSSLQSAPT